MTLIEQHRKVIALFLSQSDNFVALLDHYEETVNWSWMGPRRRARHKKIIAEVRQFNQETRDALADIGVLSMEQE